MATQQDNVPKYFADFVQENARQHQELAGHISRVEGELRVIKAIAVAIAAMVAVAVIKYVFGL